MTDRGRRLRKVARKARYVSLAMFYVALTAALLYSVFGAA